MYMFMTTALGIVKNISEIEIREKPMNVGITPILGPIMKESNSLN